MPNHPSSTAALAHYLRGIDFPRSRAELLAHARRQGAEDDSLAQFEELPDAAYHSMAEVFAGMREAAFGRAADPRPEPVPPPLPAPERPQRHDPVADQEDVRGPADGINGT